MQRLATWRCCVRLQVIGDCCRWPFACNLLRRPSELARVWVAHSRLRDLVGMYDHQMEILQREALALLARLTPLARRQSELLISHHLAM